MRHMSETKKDYAEALRELLDTDIEFEKMKKEDLEKLVEMFSEPKKLIKRLGIEEEEKKRITRDHIKEKAKKVIEERDGPVVNIIQTLID